ncbi:hypothetical protein ACPA0F_18645 [Solibacillus silvestris]
MSSQFEQYVKDVIIPQMQKSELVRMTVSDADGSKALIVRDKHGFFKVTYTTVKQYN